MLSEQQQRIMGYFIEEAKDHLNTIEQGLLNLQATIADPEMVSELFRAAHSVKGGAAMLGLDSIQHISHRLEDYFKVLKECPIQVDQKLETLFLRVFDSLQELLEQLQGPFGLTEDKASGVMAEVEPIFTQLNQHLSNLVNQVGGTPPEDVQLMPPTADASTAEPPAVAFGREVPVRLRDMLTQFKQADTASSRHQLQEICHSLQQLGDRFSLPQWSSLLVLAQQAIAHTHNSYRTLAPILIKDIKQAYELVLTSRSIDIQPSDDLQALVSIAAEPDQFDLGAPDEAAFSAPLFDFEPLPELEAEEVLPFEDVTGADWFAAAADGMFADDIAPSDSPVDLGTLSNTAPQPGPEVGLAELNSLADLFEGELPDLGLSWQEEVIGTSGETESLDLDSSSDFSDLLFDQPENDQPDTAAIDEEDLSGLLNSTGSDAELSFDVLGDPAAESELDSLDLSEFAFTDAIDAIEPASVKATTDLGNLNGLFADVEAEADLEAEAGLNGLDDLFGGDREALLFGAEPDESAFGDAFASIDAAPDDANDLIDRDPFALPASASSALTDADLDDLLGGIEGTIDLPQSLPELDAAATPWQDAEITSDLWDSTEGGLSLGEASVDDDSFALLPSTPAPSAAEDLAVADDLLFDFDMPLDFDRPAADSETAPLAADELLLDFDAPALTIEDAATSELADLSDLLGEPEAADEVLEVDLQSIDPPAASIDSEAADLADLFDLGELLGEAEPPEPEAIELAADEVILLPNAGAIDQVQAQVQAEDADLNALFEVGADGAIANDAFEDLLTPIEAASIDSELDSELSDFELLLEEPEVPAIEPDLFDLTASVEPAPLLDLAELDFTEFDSITAADTSLDESISESIDSGAAAEAGSLDAASFDLLWQESTAADSDAIDLEAADSADFFALGLKSIAPEADEPSLNFESIDLEAATSESAFDPEAEATGFDFDAIDFGLEAAPPQSELFDLDLTPADDTGGIFDLDAIAASTEEIEPFDLDTALADEAIDFAAGQPQTEANLFDFDRSAADLNLSGVFDLDADAIELPAAIDADEDALDLLLAADPAAAEDELAALPADAESEIGLADFDALLESEADDRSLAFDAMLESPVAAEADSATLADFDLAFTELEAPPADTDSLDSFLTAQDNEADLEALLSDEAFASVESELSADSLPSESLFDVDHNTAEDEEFDDLQALLSNAPAEDIAADGTITADGFADLEALLEPDLDTAIVSGFAIEPDEEFASLDALLDSEAIAATTSEFDDLEKLLENADQTLGGSPTDRGIRRPSLTPKKRSPGVLKDQNMRVSVKNLDNLNNLVGELVVNRNSLEQTQERLRQFLDNLLYQVQQLGDVGQRMRDLYERSLLESSLLSSRRSYQLSSHSASPPSHSTGMSFDALEMDRFTGFHTLSQEMIELIVRVRESASDIDFVVEESDQVTRMFRQVTTQLQEGLTRSRMVSFDQTAARLPRAVRDISLKCGKQAELVIEGKETLIDKMILEQLYDPMTHLVNNAITHGIETPAERQAAGKLPTGRITIRAFHQGNQTVISVTDDGAGIDPEVVKRKAIEKNLISPAEAREMTRLDVYDLLFLHGFSTRDRADDFAGRGVGMDVVRTSLNEVRGAVNIDSTVGRGTTFTIRLPLTLSISKALCCISNRARIAFPMDGVEDMFDVPIEQVQTDSEGRSCIQWRDALLPFQPLSDLLRYSRSLGRGSVYGGNQEENIVSVVVLRSNAGSFLALQVDQVLGEQEIVIKQLEGPVPKPVGVAGATVLGDGYIMPIADVLELIDLSQGRIRREPGSSLWEKTDGQFPIELPAVKTDPTVLIVDDSITVRELLSMTFNKVGYRVEQARDGQEAWEKLRAGLPCDLVFCDIEMPRMDGLELLSRIQKDSHLNHLPIAMLTSRGADRHRQMAVQLGAKGYFTKPYLEESLLDAAQRMLKGEVLVS